MWKKIVSAIVIYSIISISVFSASNENESHTPEEYDKSEIPQSIKDLRRFEIITLGSFPFVMMDTTLVYSGIKTASGAVNVNGIPYKVTPFANDSCFTWEQDQSKMLLISIGVSVGIGLTDLIVQLIKRSSKKKKAMKTTSRDILITPVSEDPDATLIKTPETNHELDMISDFNGE